MREKIDVLLAQAALESGLVTRPQLDECKGDAASLLTQGYLTPEQVSGLRTEIERRLASSAPTMPIPESKYAPRPGPDDAPAAAAAARAAGAKRIGKYQIVSELGRGGMGSVHKAWDASLKCWVALKVLHSDAYSALASRASSAEDLQDLRQRSLADYSEAIRLRANYPEAYRDRGALYFGMGQSDECLADFQAGLRMDPTDSTALSDLGTYFQRTDRPDYALEWYARALEANPDNFRALTNRSAIRMARKEFAAARADLERAVKINPDHLAALVNLATCRDARGETEEVVKLLSSVLSSQPLFARGYYYRGVFQFKLKRWAEALEDLEKAAGISPTEYEASGRPYLDECRKRLGRK